jgi:predicted aldo/keto reductase-like oxidoreductase
MTDICPTRREFLALAGALGTALATAGCVGGWLAEEKRALEASARGVPKRPFGKTGVYVSSLALGGSFDALANPQLLERAYELGVTYWEATLERGGKGYGAFFRRHSHRREKIFLLAKTPSRDVAGMERSLALALEEAQTSYLDFFVVQGADDTGFLDAGVRAFAERAKRESRIRFFGFSTDANMAACMRGAASLGWIDGVLTAYNYRLMQQPEIEDAIDACAQRGIALTAIESQAGEDSPEARAALARLEAEGVTEQQARLLAVWSNPDVASICAPMNDELTLMGNASAALQWRRMRTA